MLVELPNGYIDGSDHFTHVRIDELRGKQQNYLANQELVIGNIGHVPKILEDMILSLETEQGLAWKGNVSELVWKLSSGDLETILIKIRENTYGGKFYHGAQGSHCQHVMSNLLLNLDTLELDKVSSEELLKSRVVTLPKSNVVVELRPTVLKDLFEMIKITSGKQDKLITELIPLSLKSMTMSSVEGAKIISPVKSEHIENLPVSDLTYLQKELDAIKIEGTIDTNIDIECTNCKKDFQIKLNVFDPSFFDPTKGSMSGNM